MEAGSAALQPCSPAALQGFAGAQVWKYEGDSTLYDLMQRKDWPYNLEPLLFGKALDGPRTAERRLASLRLVMQQARAAGPCPLRPTRTPAAPGLGRCPLPGRCPPYLSLHGCPAAPQPERDQWTEDHAASRSVRGAHAGRVAEARRAGGRRCCRRCARATARASCTATSSRRT